VATRVYQQAVGAGDTNTQSATVWADQVSDSFDLDALSDYLLIAFLESQVDINAARDTQVRLYDDTSATVLAAQNNEMIGTTGTEWPPHTLAAIVTTGGSPETRTLKVQHKLESTLTDTDSWARKGRLVALKLGAADEWMSNDDTYTSSSNPGTWTDYAPATGDTDLTFTPGSTGDYLVLAFGRIKAGSTTGGAYVRMLCEDGTTAVGNLRWVPGDSTSLRAFAVATKRSSLAASAQTFKLQHSRVTDGTNSSTIDQVRMVALRLDGFESNTATEDATTDSATTSSYADLGDTRTDTLTSGLDYLVLGCATSETGSGAVLMGMQFTDGTNIYSTSEFIAQQNRGFSALIPVIVTGAGASVTHAWQGRAVSSQLNMIEHRIFVLGVEAAAGGDATASPATVALTLAQPAATAQAGSSVSPAATALVLAQPAVTAAGHATPEPATAALTLAQPAVSVTAGSTVSPAATALLLAQPAVTAQAGSTVEPATAALTLTQPAVAPAAGSTVSPDAAALVLAQPPVTASGTGDATASPAATTLTLAQPSVTVSAGSTVAPDTAALVLTQPAVTAQAGSTPAPTTAALVLTQPAVEAQAGSSATPDTAAFILAQPAVTASTGGSASPAAVALTLAQPTVTVSAGSEVTPATVVIVLAQPAVTATGTVPVDPYPIDVTVRERAYIDSFTEAHHPIIRERAHVEVR
jgi:hypothetical protein